MNVFKNAVSVRFRAYFLLFFLLLITLAHGDEIAEITRPVIKQWQDAVVIFNLVVEMNKYENKFEVIGTFIDSSGLAVISLSSIDPSNVGFGTSRKSKVKTIKIVFPDGQEVPAKVVLRDSDRDLAFIKPETKIDRSVHWVNLKDTATPKILEQVIFISRLNSAANYAPYVSLGRIQAIIEKPRLYYVPDFAEIFAGLGVPVFSNGGKIIGMLLLRITRTNANMSGLGGIQDMGMLPVILPAQEVLNAASHISEEHR